MPCRKRRTFSVRPLSDLKADTRAASAIEFALAAPLLVAMLVPTLEIALIYFAQQGLETAAEASARYIMTGQAQTNFTGVKDSTGKIITSSKDQFKAYTCSVLPPMMECPHLYVDVTSSTTYSPAGLKLPTFTYDSKGNITNSFSYTPGTQGAIVVVRLMYNWPVISMFGFNIANQPNSRRMILATSVMKTEGY